MIDVIAKKGPDLMQISFIQKLDNSINIAMHVSESSYKINSYLKQSTESEIYILLSEFIFFHCIIRICPG